MYCFYPQLSKAYTMILIRMLRIGKLSFVKVFLFSLLDVGLFCHFFYLISEKNVCISLIVLKYF